MSRSKHGEAKKENAMTRFKELCQIEPRLWDLYVEARAIKGESGFCANIAWYSRGGLKQRVVGLVGMCAENPDPRLHSCEAYGLAYDVIYSALPDCRHKSNIACL